MEINGQSPRGDENQRKLERENQWEQIGTNRPEFEEINGNQLEFVNGEMSSLPLLITGG